MTKCWTVFGGWAVPPGILRPIFGVNAQYIDINTLMPDFLTDEHLPENWKQHLYNKITTIDYDKDYVAGWSTGALLLLGCLEMFSPKEVILLSATPSFCRRDGFRFGTRPSVLDTMITNLKHNKAEVLKQFFSGCGIDGTDYVDSYSTSVLTAGLIFLKEASLLNTKRIKAKITLAHGTSDSIIPVDAGKYLCSQLGGTWFETEGPHAFFCKPEFDITNFSEMII